MIRLDKNKLYAFKDIYNNFYEIEKVENEYHLYQYETIELNGIVEIERYYIDNWYKLKDLINYVNENLELDFKL